MYFFLPRSWRNGWLFLVSLVFYGWGEPKNLVLMVFSVVCFYWLGIAVSTGKHRRLWLSTGIILGLSLLGIFKYADFVTENLNALLGLSLPLPGLSLPIGISFYTFQLISYLIDVYREDVKPQRSFINFGCYLALFPQLIAGPIVRYADVARELKERDCTAENLFVGIRRFLMGLSKKILIANQLGAFVELYRSSGDQSVLFAWLYAIAFSLHIYFDFSGYSDMAIGIGRMFGFHFIENFNYPYISTSIQEFWRRWHMSLGSWFRDYLYIPLGGSRVSRGKWLRNVLIVWLCTGLWHGAAWNFVVWGLFFAALLLLEKQFPGIAKLPRWVRQCYVLVLVVISFVIFNASSMAQAVGDLGAMFGLGNLPLYNSEAMYYLRSYGVIFLIAIVGCLPFPKIYVNRLNPRFLAIVQPLAMAALLLLCTAYLVDGSFNPFLYFRF